MTYDATIELNRRVTGARPASAFLPLALAAAVLAGCANPSHRAPVEDRGSRQAGPTATAAPEVAPKPPPGQENLGKPGYYAVKPGDTLIRIGLENGQNWRDIARWNNLENPDRIEVGQVVRVQPPAADTNGVVVRPVLPASRGETRAANGSASGASSAPSAAAAPAASATAPASAAPTPTAPSSTSSAARDGDDDLNWTWPAAGSVAAGFDDVRSKGLAIVGKAGDPVYAAADGRVVYAGSGLRGYGNLIIVKHNATYLSAYAHNQALLVKEDQVVRRGQKIAEMGASDADRVQLHFEIRRQGKPVDPAKLLPPR
ncbi:peptidase [Rubrivivax gelatinosus]|uniref:peptidoglycan DD-metalloendopeptidase family protein n=1 Tax=Rubrivivax gelatinosus TaxID=28068 RepID=UPI001903F8D9|nr:peptidoglycan DD-metalloendopeptidase family protein [Rubrivivax gelatinosus]MBK1612532.1 peptidase [Rubrivivax gelatinosus]